MEITSSLYFLILTSLLRGFDFVQRVKKLDIAGLGTIKLKEKPKVEGKILSATISREADRWYVSLTVEKEITKPMPVEGEILGIDVGLNHFAILSNGEKKLAPKPLEKKIKRLKRISKQHSRKIKGSKNRKKSALKLARQHRKIRNIRKDFLHKFSTELTKIKSVIIIEDLDIKSMLRSPYKLNKAIHDVGWGEFRRMLEYKTIWYGSKLILAPKYYPYYVKFFYPLDEVKVSQMKNDKLVHIKIWTSLSFFICESFHFRPKGKKT
jgi:putative transposase